jgi:hypothetical protein
MSWNPKGLSVLVFILTFVPAEGEGKSKINSGKNMFVYIKILMKRGQVKRSRFLTEHNSYFDELSATRLWSSTGEKLSK